MPSRTGECNRCGQCCGADGSPNQTNPFPRNWPEAIGTWQPSDLPPIVQMVGDPFHGGAIAWAGKIGNKTYRSIWIEGVGLCKDLAPFGDPSNYSLECPFLMPDPGDGSRPCAFAGTTLDYIYLGCAATKVDDWTDVEVAQWQGDHPACSYTWE